MKRAFNPVAHAFPLIDQLQPASAVLYLAGEFHDAKINPDLPMTKDDALEVKAYFELAYLNMQQGGGSGESWGMLCAGVNLALILAEKGIGHEHLEAIEVALDGIFEAKVRGDKTGRWGFSGRALRDVGNALDILAAQLEVASRREVFTARQQIQQRMDEGNVYRAVAA